MENEPRNFIPPRDFASARLLREQEPYHFQRQRHRLGEYPRPAQPNTSQPNTKTRVFANTQQEYWAEIYRKYLEGRK